MQKNNTTIYGGSHHQFIKPLIHERFYTIGKIIDFWWNYYKCIHTLHKGMYIIGNVGNTAHTSIFGLRYTVNIAKLWKVIA